jgi:hypothetical protein
MRAHASFAVYAADEFSGGESFVSTSKTPSPRRWKMYKIRNVGRATNRIPLRSQPLFSMRFLVVGMPFHGQYLQDAADKVYQDLNGEELWTAEGLQIPVYHTENGG